MPGDASSTQSVSKAAPRRRTAFDTVLLVGGLLLFLFLLYDLNTAPVDGSFLSPPMLGLAGAVILWPLRRQRAAQALLLAGGLLLLLWLLHRLSAVLAPFVLVYILAFVFDPLVTYLKSRHRVPRWVSALVATLILIGLGALFVLLLVPNVVNQLGILAQHLIDSIGYVREWLLTTTLLDKLEETGLVDKQALITQLTIFIQDQATSLASSIPEAAQRLVRSISSLLGIVTVVTILPVILFYTLKDFPFIKQRLVELFPTFGGRRDYLVEAGGIVGSYLRGLLIISAIAAFNVSVALLLFNVPFALLIGLMAGVLNLIPNLGAIITNVFALLLVFIFGDPWYVDAVIVVAVLLGQGLLEGSVLTPNILSQHVGLHPVLILLSLFVFGSLMGLFGLLIAVPATALLMTVYKTFRDDMTLNFSRSRDVVRPASNPGETFPPEPAT